jgi:Flp pilus assembly protein TadD
MRPARASTVLLALVLCGVAAGCASLEGARLYRSGTHALDDGDPARAVAELERAAALLPDDSAVHNHLGIAYAEAGRRAEALGAFRRAVALDCRNEAAVANLAAAEAWAKRHAEAASSGAAPGGGSLAAPGAVP